MEGTCMKVTPGSTPYRRKIVQALVRAMKLPGKNGKPEIIDHCALYKRRTLVQFQLGLTNRNKNGK